MLKSFYKYIASDLILGYFRNNPVVKGSRFFMVIENAVYRDGIMSAIEELADPITLSGIYKESDSSISEESYDTYVLRPTPTSIGIIIGLDQTATEDYLTTIRNSVGVKGSKYENYAVLFVLSDNSSSILSSINTTVRDLQDVGYPLHSKYIIEDIKAKAETNITRDFEKIYLIKHLDKISAYIEDGTCTLFDFQYALSALADKTLNGHFNEMDFFNDKSIYDPGFTPSGKDMQVRVVNNNKYYRIVSDIMNADDDDDKLSLLEKHFDERLSRKIYKLKDNGAWKAIDYQEIQTSLDRKATTANLELVDIKLPSKGLYCDMVVNEKGNPKKKTMNYIIVCDESNATEETVELIFNKGIKKNNDNSNYVVNGQKIYVKVKKDELVKQSIGLNDNHHDFILMKLPCKRSFFKEVETSFSINKKGEIVIAVPEDATTLTFGKGNDLLTLPIDNKLDWKPDARLEVPVASDDEADKIEFVVNFYGKEVKFILKLNAAKQLPPVGPGSVIGNYMGGGTIRVGEGDDYSERHALNYWSKYLDIEKLFIETGCAAILETSNDITGERRSEESHLQLPANVNAALLEIYAYYKKHNTVPSLWKFDDELRTLYVNYWKSVKDTISAIPNDRSLTTEEYNITKLGVVESWNRIYLSPFHPINIAYALEYDKQYDNHEDSAFAKKLLSPFYLIPYIYYNSSSMRPYTDNNFGSVRNWLAYEGVSSAPQERTNDITTRMVWSKMEDFIRHFKYLFQDKECPIIISTIGISDDVNVIKGIIEFIKRQYPKGVQRIELHEYVENLMYETFYEKLNRLDSIDAIIRELSSHNIEIESKGEYTEQEIIHQIFTRVSFYKHDLKECQNKIGYSHIAFYLMDTGTQFVRQSTSKLRVELSFQGLISIPSTLNENGTYIIGYGTKGLPSHDTLGYIYPMVTLLNTLYANEQNEGSNVFSPDICLAKRYKFKDSQLLESIYDNANWVTFINPEVDINFFYKQNLYIVHYTDQYTINAKYDSITVTKHINQYENMLRKPYEHYSLSQESFSHFNETMMNYFNCLNGSWMLSIVNKTEVQIREKMSIVAASIVMSRFMARNKDVYWVPVSLEEILRVTGSIGMPQEYIFTKKSLGAKGTMSDDLLMIGLDASDDKDLKLYLYPVEVKCSENSSMSTKGTEQVSHTYLQLRDHLFGDNNFTKNIYRTFFASQFLTNAEKLNANSLMSDDEYGAIEKHRFELLNLKYTLKEKLPVKEMGHAAVVSFYSQSPHTMQTSLVEGVPVCEIHFSMKECFLSVAEPENRQLDFLTKGTISCDLDVLEAIEKLSGPAPLHEAEEKIKITNMVEDTDDEDNEQPSQHPYNKVATSPLQTDISKAVLTGNSSSYVEPIKIVVGHTISSKQEVVFEPNNTKMVSHPNIGIIGTMGTGKTQFARSLIAQFSKENDHNIGGKPIGILVFDYKGDYKDKEFLDAVNGTCYKFNYPFNPLKLVVNKEVDGMNLPAITADRISDSFAKAYGLGLKQQSNIKQVIIDTYADAGITKDPSTWGKKVPTMEQVIEKYFDTYDANDKAYALFDKLRDYTIFTSDDSRCVSLFEWLDSVRVIDLTLYPDDTKKVIVSLILDLFYAEMRQLGGSKQENGLRELRAMIMVDEAHQFLKKDFNSFRSIISEGRMFGVGMILSTQNVSDFKTAKEDYSQFILSWVIHHVNSVSKAEIASIFGSSDPNAESYMKFINNAKIFESVCKIGSKVNGIRDLPFFELVKQDERFNKE